MDAKTEVRDFLTSRRARITPDEAGMTTYGPRQVPGLRREEVATLAGISVDYYNRMERGNLAGVSGGVLDAVAGALRLDPAERTHLLDLARACRDRAGGRRRAPAKRVVRPSVEWMIDAMTGAAAFVVNSRQDVLAANHLGRALFAPVFTSLVPANMARFTYLDPSARDFFTDWNRAPLRPLSPSLDYLDARPQTRRNLTVQTGGPEMAMKTNRVRTRPASPKTPAPEAADALVWVRDWATTHGYAPAPQGESGEFEARFFTELLHRFHVDFARLRASGVTPASLGDPEQLADRIAASAPFQPSPLEDLTGPFYDTSALGAWLTVSRQAIADRVRAKTLLGLQTGDGAWVYPAWQFTNDRQTIPHLTEVLRALARGTSERWTWALWLTAPNEDWDDKPAWRWLADKEDPTPVLTEAHSDAARWAA